MIDSVWIEKGFTVSQPENTVSAGRGGSTSRRLGMEVICHARLSFEGTVLARFFHCVLKEGIDLQKGARNLQHG